MSAGSSRGRAWQAIRLQVLNRDGWICAYDGVELVEGKNATVDHRVSKETWKREGREGSPDTPDNLVAACTSCNSRKGDRDDMPRINYINPRWLPAGAHH